MDAAILTEALASPELLQSIIGHFPSELLPSRQKNTYFPPHSKALARFPVGES
jgi:hypothetical protein